MFAASVFFKMWSNMDLLKFMLLLVTIPVQHGRVTATGIVVHFQKPHIKYCSSSSKRRV